MTTRRDLLRSGALLPFAGLLTAPQRGWAAAGRPRFLVDTQLPEAPQLRRQAAHGAHPCADPGGEVIVFLTRNPDWITAASPLIGLTGYADFVLARDVLRSAGRRVQQVWQLGPPTGPEATPVSGGKRPDSLLASLLGSPAARLRPGPTSFLWIA